MRNNNAPAKIGSVIFNIVVILVIIYIVFNIGKSIYSNYNVNKTISRLRAEIARLQERKIALENLIIYYQTMTFKELEARRRLGLKKPDEKLVIIPENSGTSTENAAENIITATDNKPSDSKSANYSLWWEYIVGK
ncbi:MAG: septum formation initiator family protein [Patescibacteria group bacterium]|nr:septum formation initiator family protein [Patescibacteria group bacterium]